MALAKKYVLPPVMRGDSWPGIPLIRRSIRAVDGKACVADAGTDEFTHEAHGWADGVRVIPGAAPAGLTAATVYFVIASAADTFQLSLTEGGEAVDLSAGTATLYELSNPPAALESARIHFRQGNGPIAPAVLTLTTAGDAPGIVIEDADAWEISVPARLAGFSRAGVLHWDVEMTGEDGEVVTPIYGTLQVAQDATR